MKKFDYIMISILVCGLGVVFFWTYRPISLEGAIEVVMSSEGGMVYFEEERVVVVNACREPDYLWLSKGDKKAFLEHWKVEGWNFKSLPLTDSTSKSWFVYHPIYAPWIAKGIVEDEETPKRAKLMLERHKWEKQRVVFFAFVLSIVTFFVFNTINVIGYRVKWTVPLRECIKRKDLLPCKKVQ